MLQDSSPARPGLSEAKRKLLEQRLQGKAPAASGKAPIPRRPDPSGPAPLSFAQQRIWFLHRLEPASPAYNLPKVLAVHGPLDPALFQRVLAEVVRRHQILRTTFAEVDGQPVQIVGLPEPVPLPRIDLRTLPPEERWPCMRQLAREEGAAAFDLERGPLFRVRLVQLEAAEQVLLLTMHHIVSDAWSTGVLIREIGALYRAFAAGLPSPLPDLPLQYADFAHWERQWLQGEVLQGKLAYWRERLGGAPMLDLPTDRPRLADARPQGGRRGFDLAPQLATVLREVGRGQGATPFMLLLAAFQVLLYRYSGQEDISVGTPVGGRSRLETEPLIGFFLNTLVIRTDLSQEPSFRELLARVRAAVLEAHSHQELPFEKLVEELAPVRKLSRTPLFQVMFTLVTSAGEPLELDGVQIRPLEIEGRTAKFDLMLGISERGGRLASGFSGALEYRSDLFLAATAERWVDHFARLLEGIARDPDRRISELPLLSAAEEAQLLREWNDTAPEWPWLPVQAMFELQAERAPAAEALVWGEERLSYRELDRRAGHLARRLRVLGVGPDVPVGLCMSRTADLVVAVLGILKSGGAYVPLDPGYPRERLEFMLEDTRPPVVVSEESLAAVLPPSSARVIHLDDPDPEPDGAGLAAVAVDPENISHLIFTSGSTGRPKGVAVRHRGVATLARWTATVFGPGELAGVLASTSINFDLSVFEILVPLALGGKVILAQDALHLPGLPAAGEVRLINTVPSAASELVRCGGVPASVRTVTLAGEPLHASLVERLYGQTAVAAVWNLYGPSEDTTYSTFVRVEADGSAPTIGRPLASTQAYLLDRCLLPVPLGAVGELLLGGDGLARGYWNRPDLTAERFIPDAFGSLPGRRLYRTGDLVRQLPDGRMEFLGRADHQVKVRGFRIELPEVEAALTGLPEVSEGAVLARGDGDSRRLVAYFVPARQPAPAAGELRAALQAVLPEYMVPSLFVALAAMPLSPNGKIDRKALPAPAEGELPGGGMAAPRTWAEERIAQIWSDVLGIGAVGPADNFFDLGGHSLLATRVISRIRETFGVELPLRDLFESPTVAGLARAVAARRPQEQEPIAADRESPPGTPKPVSFPQRRLWFIDQYDPGSPAYNLATALRLRGSLDVAALELALSEIVRRHQVLRTRFEVREGEPVQVAAAAERLPLPTADLRGLEADLQEAEARRRAAAETQRSFDLAAAPMIRGLLIRLGEDEQILVVTVHHIASDGWSMAIFSRELTALYAAFTAGQPSPLPELPIQYADFAGWQRRRLDGAVLEAEVAYWKERLGGVAPLELPTDRSRPAMAGSAGAVRGLTLDRALWDRLLGLARREGTTAFVLLLAAYQTLLHRYSRQDDLTVGTPVAGRRRIEVEDLIGFFVNTLVMRADLRGDPPFAALLARTREAALNAQAHQDLPFEKLVEALEPKRRLDRTPLFQVMFGWQNAARERVGLAGLERSPFRLEERTAKFDMILSLQEGAAGLGGALEYRAELFDPSTVERMLGHFSRLLEGIVADPGARLSELPLMPDAERGQVLAVWNATASAYPRQSVHELFRAEAGRNPEAVAAVFGGDTLRYRELDERSDRLARRLLDLGAGPGAPVAIYLERSLQMVVATLAVLKAGSAYIPLDPSYPADRLAFMLSDAGAPVLITQERWLDRFPQDGLRTVCLDRDRELLAGLPPAAAQPGDPESLAYVIYTSGSTGKPKGVAVPHRAIVRLVRDTNYVELRPDDVVAQASNTSFDAATFEIWGALLNGARLVGVAKETMLAPRELAAQIRRDGITVLFLTTALFNQVVREVPDAFAPLRTLLFGGEAVDPGAVRRALAGGPPERLLHVYGPTESTTYASWHLVDKVPAGAATVPIGQPLGNTTLVVLDRGLRPVPVGIAGELYVGGDGLAWGYLNRPELTAERFVPDPLALSGEPGERLYRTGDLVRRRGDGAIEFLGRVDFQVKVRGFRIELGEVEAVLAAHPQVRDAAVLVLGEGNDKRLVAYVAPPVPVADLRPHLAQRLPEFMVPSGWVPLEALPLNPNGKVDRAALALLTPALDEARELAAPRTPTEESLVEIWSQLLGVERLGIEDDFFELGGHSLLATRVLARVSEVFGVSVALRDFFENPRVAALARFVEGSAADAEEPILPYGGGADEAPLSFAQQRLWFLDQLQPGSSTYNVPVAVRLQGRLDEAALGRALSEIVRRHEVLRTGFREVGGEAVQVPAPAVPVPLPRTDLRGLPPERREAEARRLMAEEWERPFDLTVPPLVRSNLFRLADEDHVLATVVHHIASDGWSTGILVRELSALYAAFGEGRPSPLPELPIQYGDFARWQRRQLQGAALEAEVSWWKGRLAGVPSLELPTDRPYPAVAGRHGAVLPLSLGPHLSEALLALGKREGATPFVLLLAVFETLLHRYTGQEDLTVGTPIAGRRRVEVEDLIGFFVNTLVLRADLGGNPPFLDLLARAREVTLAAFTHQDLPFEKLVEALEPERRLDRTPLFQVMLALQNAPRERLDLPGLALAPFRVERSTAKFDLTLSLAEGTNGISGALEYRTDLFEAPTAARLLGHFTRLLEGVAADPRCRLSELPLLTEAEQAQLLVDWSGTDAAYGVACLHQLVEAQVDRAPGAVAVIWQDESLTYGELDRRANCLAHRLIMFGAGPDVLVGVCLERSLDLVVTLLAVLKAGGAYLPLDPGYPAERLAGMLEDSRSPVVVTESRLAAALPAGGAVHLCLDEERASLAASPDYRPRVRVDPDDLAYVIFTSGSTGRPKGVPVRHGNVVRLFEATDAWFGFGPGDVWTFFHSYAFDFSVWEIWGALRYGGRLVVVPQGVTRSPEEFHGLLQREGVTVLNQTPSAFYALIRADEVAPAGAELSLRWVIFGGEALEMASLAPWFTRHGDRRPRLANMYGITETTVHVTFRELAKADLAAGRGVIGRPIPDLRLWLLDRRGQPVPVGVPGEIHVGGAGVARGYLNHPALTAQRFVPAPFPGAAPGAPVYRSGDLARWLPDGSLEYLGRIDHQVKVRGYRIELGEVESALAGHPGVAAAVVLARGASDARRLVAYFVPVRQPAPGELRAFLQGVLPEYMVPARFVALAAMPLNANGKVDRQALPEPDERGMPAGGTGAPRTWSEERIAEIWSDVLGIGIGAVGPADNFFDLGGHSLLATRVISRVRETFGVELPLRALFENPTVEGLAGAVAALRPQEQEPITADRESPPGTPKPVSFPQRRLWFIDQYEPGSSAYNLSAALRLRGLLGETALQLALSEIVRRHEVLRTRFQVQEGEPVQVVAAAEALPLPVTDLRGLSADLREPEGRRQAAFEAQRPFDLQVAPVVRSLLIRLGEDDQILVVTVHHIASDGWSMSIFTRELTALYGAFAAGQPSPLPELPIQYADFAAWQRRRLDGAALAAEVAHWKERLAGVTPLELPTDRPRPAVAGSAGAVRSLALDKALWERLRALARREGTTAFVLLLAAFETLLHRYSRQDDLTVGTPVAGRGRIEVEDLIGFFVNTLVMRADLRGDPPFAGLLARAREAALDAQAHQDLPFEKLVEVLEPKRRLDRTPLFQVMFALQNAARERLDLAGLELSPFRLERRTAKFELILSLQEGAAGLSGVAEYRTELFDPATIERMLGHFSRLLEGIAADPEARLSELPLMGDAERDQVLVAWNDTATDYPRQSCVHELFRAQVRRNPEAIAAVFAGETLRYGELDERSDRLARRLLDLGAGPGAPVAIYLERSLQVLVATLAVLKTGAAYIPLDTAFPAERLAFMKADSGAPVLITEERWLERFQEDGLRIVCLDRDRELLAGLAPAPPVVVDPLSLACVIYTSGSTGKPKGVAVPHRAIVRLVRGTTYLDVRPDDGVGQASNTSFDAATFEIWSALLNGARLVAVTKETMLAPRELAAQIRRDRITVLLLITAVFNQVVREVPDALAPLRTLLFGGEAADPNAVRLALASGPPERLLHVYGPTESTTYASWHLVDEVPSGAATVPIGQPLSNTTLVVLDRGLRPVPVGVAGELYIGGDGLAWGYLNRPELTAERFVPDPLALSGAPGERLYRTGDLVRRRGDGAIEFLGRVDFQVKVRGFRIELGEVEAALMAHPQVRDAAVLVLGEGDDKRLVACVAPPVPPAELRPFLAQRLPEIMVPSSWVLLEALPLNPNGKVDRASLARLEPARDEGRELAAPRTPAEEALAGIWSQLLGVERLGVEDDFFELGGHSLLATRVLARVSEVFGVSVPLRDFFKNPRVEALARLLEGGGTEAEEPVLPSGGAVGGAPLSFAQQRLWFLDQLQPGSSTYNIPVAVRLSGPLDRAALRSALSEIVRRHEVLRTRFEVDGEEPVQVAVPAAPLAMPEEDLTGLPPERREAEARRRVAAEGALPFDLTAAPLLRVRLFRLDAEDHVLSTVIHHIASDGWSTSIFIRELSALYAAHARETAAPADLAGEASPLPELPIQYADFARWQRRQLQGDALEREVAWWRERLAPVPPLALPTDRPYPPVASPYGASRPLGLGPRLSGNLLALGKREAATPFVLFLTAFAALLHRYSGQDDLTLGTPIAGRRRAEVEGLIGFFVNTLVLRADLGGDPSFLELLARTRETALEAFAHQDLPFEKLVEAVNPERRLDRTPLFQVMFAFQNAPRERLALPGLELSPFRVEGRTARFDLTLALLETAGVISGGLEYRADLFDAPTAARLLGHFTRLLEGVAADPACRLSELPLLSAAERAQLLEEWNATAAVYEGATCLHQLVEAQVDRAPEAVAVVFEGERLSYGELDVRANRLAHRLIELGVGPDVPVGVCLERSLDLVVSLLAVLKAGGAYLPLDPGYPAERLGWMLEDSRAPVVVTESRLATVLPGGPAPRLLLNEESPRLAAQPGHRPAVPLDASHLAYVIFTSGSTGRPKGVMNVHGAIRNRLLWMQEAYGLGSVDRVLQKTPFSFDVSVWEFFWPLMTGARLVVAKPGGHMDPSYLADLIAREGITTLHFVPSMLRAFLGEEPELEERCASLRHVMASGEALPPDLAAAFFSRLGARLHNLYGPTEAAVDVTFWACSPEDRSVPIGRPIANIATHVVDRAFHLLPQGVPGELLLGGIGLARGYLGRPDLTAERFIPDPFAAAPGGRLYRTGDLVRVLADGRLDFLGRIDHQVKVRGFRIELAEIEAALTDHPDVAAAVVLPEGEGDARRLVAWVVPAGLSALGDAGLRSFLRERLPDYMVPSLFATLESMPLSPSGKADRKALAGRAPERPLTPGPAGSAAALRAASAEPALAPRDGLELELARLWEDLLGTAPVGVRDDFFALGGHSLLGVRLMGRIRRQFGVALPLTTLFQSPTVEGLAARLRGAAPELPASPLVTLQAAGEEPPFFLVHPVGGNVFCYRDLVRHLAAPAGPRRPVHALQDVGGAHEEEGGEGMVERAARYLGEIRKVQPSGPYRLGGWSYGGVVAFEMARQLRQAGEEVALLALIDSELPARRDGEPGPDSADLLLGLCADLEGLARRRLGVTREELLALDPEAGLDLVLARAVAAGALPADADAEDLRRLARVFRDNLRRLHDYRPVPCPVPVTLLRAEESAGRRPACSWESFAAGGLEVHLVPGNHYTALQEPRVRDLAACLAARLDGNPR